MTLTAPPAPPLGSGPRKRASLNRPSRIAAALTATFSLAAFPFLGVSVAQAATGGDASAQAAQINLSLTGDVLASLGLDFSAITSTPQVPAPANNGETNTSVVDADVNLALATVDLGAVTASTARTVNTLESSSSVAGANISLLGADILSLGAVSSSAVCSIDGSISTASEVVGLNVGGAPVDLTVNPAATVVVPVTVLGLADASVIVNLSRVADNTAGLAQGLNVDLTLQATAEVLGTAINVPVGSVILAESNCASPFADPLPPTVSSLSQAEGPTAGGTQLVVTGTGFDANTSVTLNGIGATVTSFTPTTLNITTPPSEVSGPVSLLVTNSAGSSDPFDFNYLAPTFTSVTPDQGSELGGTRVEIVGTGFAPGAVVDFGGTAASDVVVNSSTSITATTPANPAGIASLGVTLPGLDISVLNGFLYTEAQAPTVTSIDPSQGPAVGGNTVVITGTDFDGSSSVTFEGVPATSVTLTSPTSLEVIAPPGFAGVAAVVVSTTRGDSNPYAYNYIAPTIAGLSPDTGSTAGGDLVTITGTGFTPSGTSVTFDGVEATDVVVSSATSLTLLTPAHAAGLASVIVTSQLGASAPAYYTYVPPTATDVSPNSGPTRGGTSVVITGSGLNATTAVSVGDNPASFTVGPDGSLTVLTPPSVAGLTPITITTAVNTITIPDAFTYVPAALSSAAPNSGPTAGNTSVVITGTGLLGTTAVLFDGVPATSFVVDSDTSITAVSPVGEAGAADITVGNAGETRTLGSAYLYLAPSITAISPNSGPASGGSSVTITGQGFTGSTGVTFGDIPATSFVVDSDTSITALTPASAAGSVDVTVTTPTTPATAPAAFAFIAPTLTGVTPGAGPEAGGTPVEIVGSGFTGATEVLFGDVPAESFTVETDGTITALTPAYDAGGLVDIRVEIPGEDAILVDGFEYVNAAITSVTPSTGPSAGGTEVTLAGDGLGDATEVFFGDTPASSFTAQPDGTLTVVTPPGITGTVDVRVTTPAQEAVLEDGFEYLAPLLAPVVNSISPSSGPASGGGNVTILGGNFTPDSVITFDGVPVTAFTFVASTMLMASAPAGTPGLADVIVTSPSGPSNTLLYEYLPSEISSVTPDAGPLEGGTTVIIDGVGFDADSTVTFGGTPAQSVVVQNSSLIEAVTPAGDAGPADVVVTTASGNLTLAEGFTYLETAANQPVVDRLTPNAGPSAGGQNVTIEGSGFTPETIINFASVPVEPTSVTPTTITFVTPPGQPGVASVTVTSESGTSNAAPYVYENPIIGSVTPNTGSTSGGTEVRIVGSDFTPGTEVTFGGVPATNVVVVDSTTLLATTPAGRAGSVGLSVRLPSGTTATLANAFTYATPGASTPITAANQATGGGTRTLASTGTEGVALAGLSAFSLLTLGAAMSLVGRSRKNLG